jgi:uncharacterized protein
MRYLFFFVHPSKINVFRNTINQLKSDGHHVDILITSKDVLQKLVDKQGWNYTNIFPEGRKINGIPTYLSAAINTVRTIWRLLKYVRKRHYDLFITDDLLTIVGRLKGIPTIHLQDDDLSVVPESAVLLKTAGYILAPSSTDFGKYNSKKISFNGYKELGYLHPGHFIPDPLIVKSFNPESIRYFVLRVVLLKSTHDVGKSGITDEKVRKLISLLEKYGRVFISSERELPQDLEKYRLKIDPENISQVLYFADLFISDSQTMTSEAAILGTPAFRFNDFVGKISVMEEKEFKYGLSFGFKTNEFDRMYETVSRFLTVPDLKESFRLKRDIMMKDCIDLTKFMVWLFENYPGSLLEIKKNPDYQKKFL